MLYPYKTVPIFKDYLWGGDRLQKLGKKTPAGIVAESWELSTLPGNESTIENGGAKGKSLRTLIEKYGPSILGKAMNGRSPAKKNAPFLLKFIDANDKLSIQVHPDDAFAYEQEGGQTGKTEMWYILEAKPGATVLHGFRENLSSREIQEAIARGQHQDIYREIPIQKGDVVFIPAGTVHALHEGIVAAEIQQHSDLTFRIYDYDRTDSQGNKRPLHVEKALRAISYNTPEKPSFRGLKVYSGSYDVTILTACRYFCVREIQLHGWSAPFLTAGNFHAFMVLRGEGLFQHDKERLHARALDTVVIPADLGEYWVEGSFVALHVFVPDMRQDVVIPLQQAGYTLDEMYEHVAGMASEPPLKLVG